MQAQQASLNTGAMLQISDLPGSQHVLTKQPSALPPGTGCKTEDVQPALKV